MKVTIEIVINSDKEKTNLHNALYDLGYIEGEDYIMEGDND